MDDKNTQLVDQLKRNPAMLRSIMQSRDGQALMQMLTQGDQGAALQRAVQSAARGKPQEMASLVNHIANTTKSTFHTLSAVNAGVKEIGRAHV